MDIRLFINGKLFAPQRKINIFFDFFACLIRARFHSGLSMNRKQSNLLIVPTKRYHNQKENKNGN